jgi:hypothetical protein
MPHLLTKRMDAFYVPKGLRECAPFLRRLSRASLRSNSTLLMSKTLRATDRKLSKADSGSNSSPNNFDSFLGFTTPAYPRGRGPRHCLRRWTCSRPSGMPVFCSQLRMRETATADCIRHFREACGVIVRPFVEVERLFIEIAEQSPITTALPASPVLVILSFLFLCMLRARPPIEVSSASTSLPLKGTVPLSCIASRMRWSMNQAVF